MNERLIGRLEEFKVWAEREFHDIKEAQKLVVSQLERINQDRWILYGKLTVLNSITVILVEIFSKKLF